MDGDAGDTRGPTFDHTHAHQALIKDPWHPQERPDPKGFVRTAPAQICLDGAWPTQFFLEFCPDGSIRPSFRPNFTELKFLAFPHKRAGAAGHDTSVAQPWKPSTLLYFFLFSQCLSSSVCPATTSVTSWSISSNMSIHRHDAPTLQVFTEVSCGELLLSTIRTAGWSKTAQSAALGH